MNQPFYRGSDLKAKLGKARACNTVWMVINYNVPSEDIPITIRSMYYRGNSYRREAAWWEYVLCICKDKVIHWRELVIYNDDSF